MDRRRGGGGGPRARERRVDASWADGWAVGRHGCCWRTSALVTTVLCASARASGVLVGNARCLLYTSDAADDM
eukprot:4444941-Prymnesium_polylepis.1